MRTKELKNSTAGVVKSRAYDIDIPLISLHCTLRLWLLRPWLWVNKAYGARPDLSRSSSTLIPFGGFISSGQVSAPLCKPVAQSSWPQKE